MVHLVFERELLNLKLLVLELELKYLVFDLIHFVVKTIRCDQNGSHTPSHITSPTQNVYISPPIYELN